MTVNLSDLKTKRAAMTREARESLCEQDPRAVELAIRLVAPGPKACAVSASECHEITEALLAVYGEKNSPGIVATHNAADVLIAAVEAAKEWQAARDVVHATDVIIEGSSCVQRLLRAESKLIAALAKITP